MIKSVFASLCVIFTLSACGGESSNPTTIPEPTSTPTPTPTPTVDITVPTVTIDFPSDNSVVGAGEIINVRGTFGGSSASDISIIVNGGVDDIQAELDEANGTWLAENVPTERLKTNVLITATVTNNNNKLTGQNETDIGSSLISNVFDLVFDSNNNQLFYIDSIIDSLLSFDLTTNESRILLSNKIGGNEKLITPRAMAYNPNNDLIYIADTFRAEIISFNLKTSESILLSPNNEEFGPILISPRSMVFDSVHNIIYLVDRGSSSIYSIEPESGLRTAITANNLIAPMSITIDVDSQVLYVVCSEYVLAYDIQSEKNYIVSGSFYDNKLNELIEVGAGMPFSSPQGIAFNKEKNQLVVGENENSSVVSISLANGDREFTSYSLGDSRESNPVFSNLIIGSNSDEIFAADFELGLLRMFNESFDILEDTRVAQGPLIDDGIFVFNDTTAYVIPRRRNTIFTVNLTTGYRSKLWEMTLNDRSANINISAMLLDQENDRLILADSTSRKIYSVSISSGRESVLFNSQNIELRSIEKMVFNSDKTSLIILDSFLGALLDLNLTTSEIFEISESNRASVEDDAKRLGLATAFEIIDDVAYVLDSGSDAILKIDLSSGNRSILSNNDTTQDKLVNLRGMVFDSTNNRILIADVGSGHILSVNPLTGSRSIAFDNSSQAGPPIDHSRSLQLDSFNNRLLYFDFTIDGLMSIDMTSGDRLLLSR